MRLNEITVFLDVIYSARLHLCMQSTCIGLKKVTYAGIKQRWLIVESVERKQSDIQKLNSKIEQEKKAALKLRKKIETTGFDTVTQA